MSVEYYEEEEFKTQFNGQTLRRILALTRPHWRWVVGFLVTIALVSAMDSVFTYLSKLIIDNGILARNRSELYRLLVIYGLLGFVQACGVFGFIYLAGVLGERVRYDLRQKNVQPSSGAFPLLFQPHTGRLDHVPRHIG